MNSKLTNTIIDKIQAEEIRPKSKWYFRIRYAGFWLMFGTMLILGAISFAVMLFAVQNTDFEIFEYVDNGGWQQLLSLMPFVWVLLIGIAIGLGVWGLKHTKRGYRLALLFVFGGNVLGSLILGSLVYGAGGGEFIEEIIENAIPAYESVREKHERFWGRPQETGRLAGIVESIDDETGIVTVSGPRGRSWEIPKTRLQKFGTDFEVGQPLKMRGTVESQDGFLPEVMHRADRQKRMHRKIQKRFEKNPELRAKFEERLSPETRQELQEVTESGQRPNPDLNQRIRQEIKANTTPEEREEMRTNSRPKERLQPETRRDIRENQRNRETAPRQTDVRR